MEDDEDAEFEHDFEDADEDELERQARRRRHQQDSQQQPGDDKYESSMQRATDVESIDVRSMSAEGGRGERKDTERRCVVYCFCAFRTYQLYLL